MESKSWRKFESAIHESAFDISMYIEVGSVVAASAAALANLHVGFYYFGGHYQ